MFLDHRPGVRGLLRAGVATLALGTAGVATAQELVIAMPASNEPASLDGHIDPYQSTWLMNSFISDPLVVLSPEGEYLPGLATDWSVSDNGTEWTFTLREGVTFQDGTPFDAEAVRFNLARIIDPETASAQLASDVGPIAEIEVTGSHSLTLHYDTPWVTLLDGLRRTPMWSPTAVEQVSSADFDKNLVGTGPFRLSEWVQNDHVTLERWDEYGGWHPLQDHEGPANVETVTLQFIGEEAVLGQILQTGEADVAYTVPPLFLDFYQDNPEYDLVSKGQAGTGLQMVMNIRTPPLDDVRVRRALLHGKDADAVNDILYDGLYGESDGPLNNIHACYWEGAEEMYPHDTARAGELLQEAGWVDDGSDVRKAEGVAGVEDGTALEVRWSVLHHQAIGEVAQAQYRDIGVDLQVEVIPGPVQLDMVQRRDFELIYERQRSPQPLILDQVWNSKWDEPGGWAWTGYENPELDGLLDQLRSIPGAEARCDVARDVQEIIMENALMVPTLSQPVYIAMDESVDGFQIGAEGNWFFLHNVSIAE